MRDSLVLIAILVTAVGCDDCDLKLRPDAGPGLVEVCPGEQLVSDLDPNAPLFGERCFELPPPSVTGCRRDPSVPGGYAGFCVDGICRPICGVTQDGVITAQCCLRGGVPDSFSGVCICVPEQGE
jgi:hypothetical protein